MSSPAERAQRRARRLVALYPRSWRERFGEEFTQLLVDECGERPRCTRRTLDVAAHALLARLAAAGVAGTTQPAGEHASRALRALGVIVALFLVVAIGIWSQLDVGWSWAAPSAPGTRVAIWAMSGALLGLCGVLLLATALVVRALVGAARRGSPGRRWAAVVIVVCTAAFAFGCAQLWSWWPGGRHPAWGEHSLLPPVIARAGWAGTQWITAYWLHPGVLAAQPGHRLLWSAVSPVLLLAIVIAAHRATRSVALDPGSARALSMLAAAASVLAALFVVAAASWILSAQTGPREIFQAGSVDDVALVVLAIAMLSGGHVARRVASAAARPSAGS